MVVVPGGDLRREHDVVAVGSRAGGDPGERDRSGRTDVKRLGLDTALAEKPPVGVPRLAGPERKVQDDVPVLPDQGDEPFADLSCEPPIPHGV
nr:hypothetical protein [Myceligenerans xiligouense]